MCPLQVISDQGREFDNRLVIGVCEIMGLIKYGPPLQGFNQRGCRKVVGESQRDWDERVPMVMAAYRASRHESTGYSPNCLVFGREVRALIDLVLGAQ